MRRCVTLAVCIILLMTLLMVAVIYVTLPQERRGQSNMDELQMLRMKILRLSKQYIGVTTKKKCFVFCFYRFYVWFL